MTMRMRHELAEKNTHGVHGRALHRSRRVVCLDENRAQNR